MPGNSPKDIEPGRLTLNPRQSKFDAPSESNLARLSFAAGFESGWPSLLGERD